ncbi:TetR/AcrR family transcriptional regulator [Micromonospora polyrhachis]|uniref:AcrR family transcriptional regulator n=1 Tax=Micromonospora polyrhachis TaxID=1282883 RepID=A0A7W7SQW9_9ACTN|nr:TetR/AcrR family transcriptional regulator [Micromonospora polyrhachis]MBB4959303.1 AcrR family transcriptional regulator [Micromonospora polyrhachis]
MPRISAPTVAQHRAAQRRALLDAARAVLAENGDQPPALATVAARAGLARSSVYQYFRSRQDLLGALIEDVFPRWSSRVTEAMGALTDPGDRVLAYVDTNLVLVAEGEHAIARALAATAPGEELDHNSRVMHEQLLTPLVGALTDQGATDPASTAEMINAVVYAASRMIESGADEAAMRDRARELLAPYLGREGHPGTASDRP